VGPKHFENRWRREWWSLHIEAWRRNGLGIRKYGQQHRLTENTFRSWLKRLAGEATALKIEKQQKELRRERVRKPLRTQKAAQVQGHFGCTQSGVSGVLGDACRGAELERNGCPRVRCRDEAVAALAAQWRDRLDAGELMIDWRPSSSLRPARR
jgi:hypothetical protein